MVDGKCAKDYPKFLRESTEVGCDSYHNYRRRAVEDGGNTGRVNIRRGGTYIQHVVDNRWVVPYNPFLLKQFNSHINVEICSSIKSIKYVLKYVTKGSDQSVFQLQREEQADEIAVFQNARYVSSTEAAWRILEHPIHEHFPPVIPLAVHLENGQRVIFNEQNAEERAEQPPTTTLTAFFNLCQNDPFASTLLYPQVPEYYTWDKARKVWNKRKRGQVQEDTVKAPAIGRVYTVSPRAGECYFLRMLLHEVKGPTSFQDLRTVDGKILKTYREACLERQLLENDHHLQHALQEASISHTGQSMRTLMAIILTSCDPSNPIQLWNEFEENMCEDILHNHKHTSPHIQLNDEIRNISLCLLENLVIKMGGHQLTEYGLPVANHQSSEATPPREYQQELYDTVQMAIQASEAEKNLTPEQRKVYEAFNKMLMEGTDEMGNNILFLDAPGGTGKTYLINLILAKIRADNGIALATASSGIAATLLQGGRTLHSTFKIPLDVDKNETSTCNISKTTVLARIIRETKAIIVDEASMVHKAAFEAVDKTLRDIKECDRPFGGIPTLLSGDFRQILPVIKQGTRANIVNACLKKSLLWLKTSVLKLTTNMRAHLTGDKNAQAFSELLLDIGNGSIPVIEKPDVIKIPESLGNTFPNLDSIKVNVFPDLSINGSSPAWLSERALLSPLNSHVNMLNHSLIEEYPGEQKVYKSVDSAVNEEEAVHFPVEFLNSLDIPGIPSHILRLKIGAPIIVLRSLCPPQITNGTRCVIKQMMTNVIEVEISNGPFKGEIFLIPRIPIIPSDVPFHFKRLQFPIRLCFAMTIHKAQGQTLNAVGVDLTEPLFSHGMLYVAASRTGNPSNLFFCAPDYKTKNVVYKEVL